MNKQQRLTTMKQGNRKWFFLRVTFAIPFAVLLFLLLQTTTQEFLYGVLLVLTTLLYGYALQREYRFMSSFTEHVRTKRLISIQYVFDYVLILFIGLVFPWLMKSEAVSWLPFVGFTVGIFILSVSERALDEKVRQSDSEQPMRREVRGW
ncbi:hypothetical protein [Exiguobacterium aurantiacum]|uniref:Uncharacterized protein n=1 Tax=Exiguobacterium aurantiacum TaxID=33987 RepID=A0A377FWN6_9BACL|nr:hypothetical protein [Exiguobacterium aurantiacum]STO09250.1 Uncharacterised protein [Exiguobacterium aurantiacum]